MKSFTVVLAIALTASCAKFALKFPKKLRTPILPRSCKNIKCPATEDPVCVKLKHRKDELANRTTYVLMINKCELNYMKCHQNVEAVLAPMTHCDHKHVENAKKPQVIHLRRAKRSAKYGPNISKNKNQNKHLPETNRTKAKQSESNKKTGSTIQKRVKTNSPTAKGRLSNDKKKNILRRDQNEDSRNVEEEQGSIANIVLIEPASGSAQEEENTRDNEVVFRQENEDEKSVPEYNADVVVLAPGPNNPGEDAENDFADEPNDDPSDPGEYGDGDDACPSECPSRAVMVCGKCNHGVYRTFMSVCHLRMFNCKTSYEEMELVSRSPCILSAPYLTSTDSMDMGVQGRVDHHEDEDRILNYIQCREKGLLDKVKSGKYTTKRRKGYLKCAFENEAQTLKLKDGWESYGY